MPDFTTELKKMREDFLWFSYFGKKKSDKPTNEQIKVCAERAYLDLARNLSYSLNSNYENPKKNRLKPKKEGRDNFDEAKRKFKNEVIEELYHFADDILFNNGNSHISEEDYDKSFHECCNAIIDKAKKEKYAYCVTKEFLLFDDGISFGHAQKWINMTVKNMLIMGLWNNRITEQTLNLIHVPIDSLILERVDDLKCPFVKKEGGTWKLSCLNDRFEPWSKIPDYDSYFRFQEWIRNNIPKNEQPPILWENNAWINAAAEAQNSDQ